MAYIDVVVNAAGVVVERTFIGDTGNGWYPGAPSSDVMQLPDRIPGSSVEPDWMRNTSTEELLRMPPEDRAQAAGISYELPPEVLNALAPGVDPFASFNVPLGGSAPLQGPMNPAPLVRQPLGPATVPVNQPMGPFDPIMVVPGHPEYRGGPALIVGEFGTLDSVPIMSSSSEFTEVRMGDPRLWF